VVDVYDADQVWVGLASRSPACGVAAATVVAWFHGERGRQQSNILEWILLSVIGVVWLTLSAWMIFGA
jgi:hypothetical protein